MAPPYNFSNTAGDSGISPDMYQAFMGYSKPAASSNGIFDMGMPTNIANQPVINSASLVDSSGGNGLGNLWGALGSTDANGNKTQGWGGLAVGGLQTGFNIWQGMNQLKMAKDQLNFTKDAFNKNYAAQRQSTNTALADRQAARVASNAGAYQSVGDYMNQNRIA